MVFIQLAMWSVSIRLENFYDFNRLTIRLIWYKSNRDKGKKEERKKTHRNLITTLSTCLIIILKRNEIVWLQLNFFFAFQTSFSTDSFKFAEKKVYFSWTELHLFRFDNITTIHSKQISAIYHSNYSYSASMCQIKSQSISIFKHDLKLLISNINSHWNQLFGVTIHLHSLHQRHRYRHCHHWCYCCHSFS